MLWRVYPLIWILFLGLVLLQFLALFHHLYIPYYPKTPIAFKLHFLQQPIFISIVALFREEAPYLGEWIDYHLNLGVNKIFLVDNNVGEDDLDAVRNISMTYYPTVEIIDKRDREYLQAIYQTEIYQKMNKADWCFYMDIDEFITIKEGTLKQFIQKGIDRGCQEICLNWLTYGNNGQKKWTAGKVVDRFPEPVNCTRNGMTKCVVQGGMKGYPHVHSFIGRLRECDGNFERFPVMSKVFVQPPRMKYAVMRHYYTKSEEEYRNKIRKFEKNVHYYGWKNYNYVNCIPPNVPNENEIKCAQNGDNEWIEKKASKMKNVL